MPYKRYYKTWFPTLERTLVCLSKLYLAVDSKVFEGLATEAIGECTLTLVNASKLLAVKKSTIDSLLFLIRHLLLLREQITPFDSSFSVTQQTLDFTHTIDAFRNIINNKSNLFSFTTQNPLYTVVQQSIPQIETQQVDSRKDLEKELKIAVETFIMVVTKSITDPLLSFLTKSTAFLNVKGTKSQITNENDLIRNQVFASPDRIKQIIDDVNNRINVQLPTLLSQLKIYINNPITLNILYRPIKDQIMESLQQLTHLINTQYLPEDRSILDLSIIQLIQSKLDSYIQSSNSNINNNNDTNNVDLFQNSVK